ncbi:DUF1254 domain-containing protein, partial [Brevibacillus agri]|uniref:DUF1254 domain-containing protein n=2 Tax=Brevibacillus agri TaxID=51101 RepID=UPI003D1993AB
HKYGLDPANPQNRYFTVQMLDVYTNTFRNVSNRSTRQEAARYLLVGPNWIGNPPPHTPVITIPPASASSKSGQLLNKRRLWSVEQQIRFAFSLNSEKALSLFRRQCLLLI